MHTLKAVSPWKEILAESAAYLEYCPSTLLQSKNENDVACQKFVLKYLRKRLKIGETREIKDPAKFSAIR